MSEEERFAKGAANFRKVYGDVLPMPERMDADAFTSMTFRNLFGDVWDRDQMSMRERRLLILAAIIGQGADVSLFEIHAKSALANREMTQDDLLEVIVTLVSYVGYPRASPYYMRVKQLAAAAGAQEAQTKSSGP